jgi:fumarate hydratase class II
VRPSVSEPGNHSAGVPGAHPLESPGRRVFRGRPAGGADRDEERDVPQSEQGPGQPARTERDSMGEMRVPAGALYGASTQRAVINFPVSGRRVPEGIILAYALIKAASARANERLGLLDAPRAAAIVAACDEIAGGLEAHGGLGAHFPIDIFQTGSGTSTNMNVNEVVANLVCLRLGRPVGSSKDPAHLAAGGVHPNDHVNMGQSSNDTFPTAMHVAAARAIKDDLLPAIARLADALRDKAAKWDGVVKIGRTHLMDATPIRLGQEFSGYAAQMSHGEERLHRALHSLGELPIGGTAVGTGVNTHEEFAAMVAADLSRQTGIHFREAANHFEAQHHKAAVIETSGLLKVIAVGLTKIANDIRLMGSGPRCGLGELRLPPAQPGSSIMPGKVNPVVAESLIQACCQVIGNDAAVTAGGLGGVGSILELNVAMPMLAANLLESISLLARGADMFTTRLVEGLEADEARCAELIEGSLALAAALVPLVGYDRAAELANRAGKEGRTIRDLACEQLVGSASLAGGTLTRADVDRALDPRRMTSPGATGAGAG